MMKKLMLLLCFPLCLMAQGQREKAEAYVNSYKELAISEMLRSGVPATITLAQGILESQYGESDLVKTSNNHFGIKCKTEWTGPKTYHDDDEKGECFRVYATAADSYRDHSDFLKTRPHYAFLFKLDPTDYEGWARGLRKAGYATSTTYPQQLLKVISDYNLQQYSLMALARLKNDQSSPGNAPATTATANPEPVAAQQAAPEENQPETREKAPAVQEEAETVSPAAPVIAAVVKKNSSYPQGIFTINHLKVIYASEGTSLLSLANQYDISLGKLLGFNELPEMDVLDTDRLIFLEKKQKKGAADFHIVAPDETLHEICQKEGIRLENLLEYNNLNREAKPVTGDKLWLHTSTTAAAAKNAKTSK